MATNYRKNFLMTNKYQKRVIALPLFSTLILCTILSIIVFNVQQDFLNAILHSKNMETVQLIDKWAVLFIFYLWTFFIIVIIGAFTIASNLVGAFKRVIKELDLVLAGKKTTHIYSRKDDELAQEILKRINVLIDRTQEEKELII